MRHRTCVGAGYSSLRHSRELSLLPSGWLQRLSRLAAIWTRGAPRRYYLHRVRSACPRIHEFVLRSAPVRYRSRAISARRERVVIPSRSVCACSVLPRAFPLQVAGEHQFPHPSSRDEWCGNNAQPNQALDYKDNAFFEILLQLHWTHRETAYSGGDLDVGLFWGRVVCSP